MADSCKTGVWKKARYSCSVLISVQSSFQMPVQSLGYSPGSQTTEILHNRDVKAPMNHKESRNMEAGEHEPGSPQGAATIFRHQGSCSMSTPCCQPTYLLIDEFHKFLQSIICCNPAIQGLCKLFNFSFKTARLFCKMIQKILNIV